MCCNTRSGPRSALAVFEEFTQKYVSQQEWHSLRHSPDGKNSIAGASASEILAASRSLAAALNVDSGYEMWLRSSFAQSRISGGATRQICALAEAQGDIGRVRTLRRDSTAVGLAKAMGCSRGDIAFHPDRAFLSHIQSLPDGQAQLLADHSPALSAAPLRGVWASGESVAVLGADLKVLTFSSFDPLSNTFEVRLLQLEAENAYGPAKRFRLAGRRPLTRELIASAFR